MTVLGAAVLVICK